jgi:hypothetical protein
VAIFKETTSVTNLNAHLKSVHDIKIKEATSLLKSPVISKNHKQVPIDTMLKVPKISMLEKKKLDELYVDAVVDTSLCHSWGRSSKVKEFISALNPGFKLPETRKIKSIMEEKKTDLMSNMRVYLSKSCATGTLSADGWSAHSKSFFALLLHYVDFTSMEPITILLGMVKKSIQDAVSLKEQTSQILKEWGLEDQLHNVWEDRFIKYFTSDTTNVMPAFVKSLGMHWIPCAAHLMNLVVSGSLINVKNLIKRAAILVRYFKKSSKLTDKLLKKVGEFQTEYTSLKQRNNTRWNSVYEMIDSLVKNRRAIEHEDLLGKKTNNQNLRNAKELKNNKVNLKNEQWESLIHLKDILLPFKIFTKMMSVNSRPSISMLLPLITKLFSQLETLDTTPFSPLIKKVVSSLSSQLVKRFDYLKDPIFLQATLIDPATKSWLPENHFLTEKQDFILKADNWCKHNNNDVLENETQETSTSWFAQKTSINSPTSILLDSRWKFGSGYAPSDVLAYFDNSEHPSYFKSLYIMYCGIPAASVEVERLWSRAGQIYSDKRNRMFDQTLSCELFLKMNYKVNIPSNNGSDSRILDFKNPNAYSFEALAQTELQKIFPCSKFSEVVETGDDASEIDCENDEELKLLVEEEDHLSECDTENSCDADELDFWGRSNAPKNFNNNLTLLSSQKRKRADSTTSFSPEAKKKEN